MNKPLGKVENSAELDWEEERSWLGVNMRALGMGENIAELVAEPIGRWFSIGGVDPEGCGACCSEEGFIPSGGITAST